MGVWNWYNHLMGNSIAIVILITLSIIIINWWSKKEDEWKRNNTFGTGKKVIKFIGIILIAIFGLPPIIMVFGSI
jgi:hypothetical protein